MGCNPGMLSFNTAFGRATMNRELGNDIGKLVLRLTLGLLMLPHGIQKLISGVGWLEGMLSGYGIPGFVAYGVLIGEIVAPLLILLGLFARIGGGLVILNMLFAIALIHGSELFALSEQGGWALELQGFFLLTGAAVALLGSGRFALKPD